MGILFAIICAIGYSSNYILIQLGMEKSKKDNGDLTSMVSAVATVSVAFILITLFRQTEMPLLNRTGFFFYLLAGFSTAFLGRLFLSRGIRKIGSTRASGLKNSAPIFTIFIAVVLMGEQISYGASLGMSIIFIALFLQARFDFKRNGDVHEKDRKYGLLLSITAAICFGIGQAARKQGIIYYSDPILGSLIGSVFALVAFLIFEFYQNQINETFLRSIKSLNYFFVGAGICTAIAQLSFFISLLYTHVSYTSAIAAVEPIVTVILSKIFLKKEENVTLRLSLTAFAIFLGASIMILNR